MKNALIDLWFPHDYYDILDYIQVFIIGLHIHMKSNIFKTWQAKHKTKIITTKSCVKKRKEFEGWQDVANF